MATNDQSDQRSLVLPSQTATEGTKSLRAPGPYDRYDPSNEIDLFDIIFAIKRQWKWILVPTVVATLAAVAVLLSRPTLHQVQTNLDLALDDDLAKFVSARIPGGENEGVSAPEFRVIDRTMIFQTLKKKSEGAPYGASPDFELNTLPLQEAPKTSSLQIEVKGSSIDTVQTRLAQLVTETNGDVRLLAQYRINQRLGALDDTIAALQVDAEASLKNKIEQRQKDLAAQKVSLQHKIQTLETESRLNHQMELARLVEQRSLERLTLERRFKELTAELDQTRQRLITTYEMALNTATKLGIENPVIEGALVSEGPAFKNTTPSPQDPIYLRGSKALKLELDFIKSRQSDAVLLPQIKTVEAKLKLSDEQPAYIIAKARQSPEDFNTQIPPLKSQIQAIDQDPELLALQKQLQSKDLKHAQSKAVSAITQEKSRLKGLVPRLEDFQGVTLTTSHGEGTYGSKKWLGLLVGVMVGLLCGCMLAFLREGWVKRVG